MRHGEGSAGRPTGNGEEPMKEVTVPELLRTLEGLRLKLDGLGSYL